MAVFALGASVKRPQKEMIEAAKGIIDSYGNRFEIIEVKAKVNVGTYSKERGYEDAIVSIGPKGKLIVTYRKPGKITWVKAKYGSERFGQIPKTPWNMKTLASVYFDNRIEIVDPVTRAEVVAMANKMRNDLTDDQRKYEEQRIKGLHSRPDIGKLPGRSPAKNNEYLAEQKEKDLLDLEKRLKLKELELIEKERELTGKKIEKISVGEMPSKFTMEALGEMPLGTRKMYLKKLWGVEVPKRSQGGMINDVIMKLQNGEMTPEEVQEYISPDETKWKNSKKAQPELDLVETVTE